MTPARMPLDGLLDHLATADTDALRQILEHAVQVLIEAEGAAAIGAGRHERTPERQPYRNGYRFRAWDTRVGRLELGIPKPRQGWAFPSLLEPRRRVERAFWALIQDAYGRGVSTCKADDLVAAAGEGAISKSEVSRICLTLDAELAAFRERRLDDAAYRCTWFNDTFEKVRGGGRIVS